MQHPHHLPTLPDDRELRDADPFEILALAYSLLSFQGECAPEAHADLLRSTLALLDRCSGPSATPETRSHAAAMRAYCMLELDDLPGAFRAVDPLVRAARDAGGPPPQHLTAAVRTVLAKARSSHPVLRRAFLSLLAEREWPDARAALVQATTEPLAEGTAEGGPSVRERAAIAWVQGQREDPAAALTKGDAARLLLEQSPLRSTSAWPLDDLARIRRARDFAEQVAAALSPPSFDHRTEAEHRALVELQLEALRVLFQPDGRKLQRADPERWHDLVRRFGWRSFHPMELECLVLPFQPLPRHEVVVDEIADCLQELVDAGASELLPSLAHQRMWQAVYAAIGRDGGAPTPEIAAQLLAEVEALDQRAIAEGVAEATQRRVERYHGAAELLAFRFAADLAPVHGDEDASPQLHPLLRALDSAFGAGPDDFQRAMEFLAAQEFDIESPVFEALPEVQRVRDLYHRAWESAAEARRLGDLVPSLRLLQALDGGLRLTESPSMDLEALLREIELSDDGPRALAALDPFDRFITYEHTRFGEIGEISEDVLEATIDDIRTFVGLDPEHACWLATQEGHTVAAIERDDVRALILDVAIREGTTASAAAPEALQPVDYLALAVRCPLRVDFEESRDPTSIAFQGTVDLGALDRALRAIATAPALDAIDRAELVLDASEVVMALCLPEGPPEPVRERLQQAVAAMGIPALLRQEGGPDRLAHPPGAAASTVVNAARWRCAQAVLPKRHGHAPKGSRRGQWAHGIIEALFDLDDPGSSLLPAPSAAMEVLRNECRAAACELLTSGLTAAAATEQAMRLLVLLGHVEARCGDRAAGFSATRVAQQLTLRLEAQQAAEIVPGGERSAAWWRAQCGVTAGRILRDPQRLELPRCVPLRTFLPALREVPRFLEEGPSSQVRPVHRRRAPVVPVERAPGSAGGPPAPDAAPRPDPGTARPSGTQPPRPRPFER